MPNKKANIDEIVTHRKDISTDSAPVLKAAKAPASWNGDNRSARFVMNAQAKDRYNDIVVTEGIETDEFEKNPVGLLFHNSRTWPVATWGNLEKVLKGRPPRLEGDFILLPPGGPIKEIEETEWMLANGGIRACSIGFMPDWDEAEMILDDEGKWTGGIKWGRTTLLECSICAVPASPQSLVKTAGRDINLARELLEDVLDNWVRTPEGLICSRAEFEKFYKLTTEKIGAPAKPKDPNQLELPVAAVAAAPAPAAAEPEVPAEPAEVAEIGVADIEAFLAKAQEGDKIILASDVEEIDPVFAEDGVWRSFKKVANSVRLELHRDDAIADQLPLVGKLSDEAVTAIAARQAEVTKAAPAPTDEEAPPATVEKIVIPIGIDTDEVEEDLSRIGGLIDGFAEKIAKMFGLRKDTAVERVEPVVDTEPPLPSPEAIAMAKGRALAVRARVSSKGFIA